MLKLLLLTLVQSVTLDASVEKKLIGRVKANLLSVSAQHTSSELKHKLTK